MSTLTVNGEVCESKSSPLPHHRAGLTYTASGYGARIPTTRMVRYRGRWRRVYCAQWANVGTCYLLPRSANLIVSD